MWASLSRGRSQQEGSPALSWPLWGMVDGGEATLFLLPSPVCLSSAVLAPTVCRSSCPGRGGLTSPVVFGPWPSSQETGGRPAPSLSPHYVLSLLSAHLSLSHDESLVIPVPATGLESLFWQVFDFSSETNAPLTVAK